MNFNCNLPISQLNKVIICDAVLATLDHLIFVRGQAPNISRLIDQVEDSKKFNLQSPKRRPKSSWKQAKFLDQFLILREDISKVCIKNLIHAVTIYIGPTIASAKEGLLYTFNVVVFNYHQSTPLAVYRFVFSNNISQEESLEEGLRISCKRYLIRFLITLWQQVIESLQR